MAPSKGCFHTPPSILSRTSVLDFAAPARPLEEVDPSRRTSEDGLPPPRHLLPPQSPSRTLIPLGERARKACRLLVTAFFALAIPEAFWMG